MNIRIATSVAVAAALALGIAATQRKAVTQDHPTGDLHPKLPKAKNR